MIKRMCVSLLALVAIVAGIQAPAQAALTYYYAGAGQNVTDSQVYVNMSLIGPTLNVADYHTLGEVNIEAVAGSKANRIEFGYNVDHALYGDYNVHLFVGWAKNGTFCGYNFANVCGGAGFQSCACSPPFTAGATIPAGTNIRVGALHSGVAWWLYVKNLSTGVQDWFGFINDANWTTAWTTFKTVQIFGEVAANSTSPVTTMGNGACATATTGAAMGSITYTAGNPVSLGPIVTDATKYNFYAASASTFRYGGDGSCP